MNKPGASSLASRTASSTLFKYLQPYTSCSVLSWVFRLNCQKSIKEKNEQMKYQSRTGRGRRVPLQQLGSARPAAFLSQSSLDTLATTVGTPQCSFKVTSNLLQSLELFPKPCRETPQYKTPLLLVPKQKATRSGKLNRKNDGRAIVEGSRRG